VGSTMASIDGLWKTLGWQDCDDNVDKHLSDNGESIDDGADIF
jgi:hypothetical protein